MTNHVRTKMVGSVADSKRETLRSMYRQRHGLVADQVLLSVLIRKDVACVAVPTFIRRLLIC